jgi:serine phosphatase RsbU (regulator of sigma subunit)
MVTTQAVGEAGISIDAVAALARAVAAAASRSVLADALGDLAEAARSAAGAELALVRVATADGAHLETAAVAGPAPLAAELAGTRCSAADVPERTLDLLDGAPAAVRRTAEKAGARSILAVPIRVDGTAATLELYRGGPFSPSEQLAAELAAAETALVLRAFAVQAVGGERGPTLELAGAALAAALDETAPAAEVARVAASVGGASAALFWERGDDGALELTGAYGLPEGADVGEAGRLAAEAPDESGQTRPVQSAALPAGLAISAALPLGQPPTGVLQLLFGERHAPTPEQLARLKTFGVRAAHALRAGNRARELAVELERTRALLVVIGQATSELSLAHTLATAVERVAELYATDRVAVYLWGADDQLVSAADIGLTGPHARVAERLLDVALGPARRRRPVVEVVDTAVDARFGEVRDAARESGIEAAFAAPLLARDEIVGLLAVYPEHGRRATESESMLLAALAVQLAVAVQNAQLHERTSELSRQREAALASEREAARRLGALYEISRSFATTMSLQETLDALARTVADVLDVDAAVIRMPDARREVLEPRAIHVKDPGLAEAVRTILWRPQPFGTSQVQRLFREAVPFRLRRRTHLGQTSELLEPFLEKGWTGVIVPVATPAEVVAALSILSFRPGSPITTDTIDAALAIAGQAALAIDNARLYQQQKEFADTMQRSLLPRTRPAAEGLEVGEVYESSARVDVGGDVYDFLTLDDGRLAVVLGDVTGHGVDATADMAMAKFVFRSLAREHPEPTDFLAAVNDVIVDEIATGKFITMAYLAIDGARGEVACASAGHPPPRLVLPDGTVSGLEANGLALGIDPDQSYVETRVELPHGTAIVVYTDGVLEARRDGELYGLDRLDALLAARRDLPPAELAAEIAGEARAFAGGELVDDLAVVVIKRA